LGIETEIKIKIEDAADFCRQLDALNPGVVSDRHFEDNFLLDFPDQKLRSGRCLLRIRFAEGRGCLTFKGPPKAEGIFKSREELETGIEDGATLLQVLEQIGLLVTFRYQKYRREFTLDGVHVAVDETPIGNYVEFEGSEEEIRSLARKMRIAEPQFLRLSYYSLYLEHCQSKGKDPTFMIF
jgi:adenylate cyclase class 2